MLVRFRGWEWTFNMKVLSIDFLSINHSGPVICDKLIFRSLCMCLDRTRLKRDWLRLRVFADYTTQHSTTLDGVMWSLRIAIFSYFFDSQLFFHILLFLVFFLRELTNAVAISWFAATLPNYATKASGGLRALDSIKANMKLTTTCSFGGRRRTK